MSGTLNTRRSFDPPYRYIFCDMSLYGVCFQLRTCVQVHVTWTAILEPKFYQWGVPCELSRKPLVCVFLRLQ